MLIVAVVLALSSTVVAGPVLNLDLREIDDLACKGRVQDKAYNPSVPVVDRLIASGPAAIPFLVSKLEDEAKVPGCFCCCGCDLRVGDVALVILNSFFLESNWQTSTVPGLGWNTLLEARAPEIGGWESLEGFVAVHGRVGLRKKVERLLEPYGGRFVWDTAERCFRPEPQAARAVEQMNRAHPESRGEE